MHLRAAVYKRGEGGEERGNRLATAGEREPRPSVEADPSLESLPNKIAIIIQPQNHSAVQTALIHVTSSCLRGGFWIQDQSGEVTPPDSLPTRKKTTTHTYFQCYLGMCCVTQERLCKPVSLPSPPVSTSSSSSRLLLVWEEGTILVPGEQVLHS